MALTVSARARWTGPSTPALIRAAALCAAVGISLSITEYGDYGRWLTVVGVLLLIVGLHRFGRTGPDPAIVFETLPALRRKKRQKKKLESSSKAASAEAEADSQSKAEADSER